MAVVGDDQGLFELLLVLAGLAAGGWGAYKRDVRVVGAGVVLLALAILALHYIGG